MTTRQLYLNKYWDIIIVLIIISLAAFLRSNLLSVPLERDEGEYAYTAQLILQGIPPYAEAYSMKMPGIYGVYALLLTFFGKTHTGIHLGLLVVNAATIFLLFLLVKREFDPLAAVVTSASFAILSLNQSVQGVFANAEHFVILAVVGGTLLLMRAITFERPNSLFWSGLLFGTAFIIKQHGLAFVAFAGLYLLIMELRRRPFVWKQLAFRWFLFAVGVALPLGLISLLFLVLGIFDRFWFWTFAYAREYVSIVPFQAGMEQLLRIVSAIITSSILIFILAGIGLLTLIWNRHYRSRIIFVLLFLIFSWLAVFPGFYFRPHYFVLVLPSIALLAGICLSSLDELLRKGKFKKLSLALPVLLLIISLVHSGYYQRDYLFELTPTKVARRIYGANPFPESLEIAEYIRENSSESDRIAVLGSEPQIYFYANRRAATGYLYTYPLMEPHPYSAKMQREMIDEIESARPEFLVFVNIRTSWLVRPASEKMIFSWLRDYQQKYYKTVGFVDILSAEKTVSCWDDACARYSPRSKYWLEVFRRKKELSSDELFGTEGDPRAA